MFFHSQGTPDKNSRSNMLAIYTGPLRLLLAGFLSGLTLSGLLIGSFRLLSEATQTANTFLFPTSKILPFLLFIIIAGTLDSLLHALQKIITLRIPERDIISNLGINTLKSIFPLALWIAGWLLFQSSSVFTTPDDTLASTANILTGGLTAMVMHTLWYKFFNAFLSGITTVDWRMIIDKRRFTDMLRLLFAEGRRYNIPLTLLLLEIKSADKTPISTKQLLKLRETMLERIPQAMRSIDMVARLEDGNHIGILLHTKLDSLRYPIARIKELFLQCSSELSIQKEAILTYAAEEYTPGMNHEREMYDAVLQKIQNDPQNILN